ncbi:hypothetical protein bcgnr5390_10370 [Bacillus luti]|nr:hypothetical protein BC2903_30540 [Bacillus cereus]
MEKKDTQDKVNAVSKDAAVDKDFGALRREMEEFEEGFPDGVYTAPSSPNEPRIKVRDLYQYCRKKGVNPNELSQEEAERFLVYPDRD